MRKLSSAMVGLIGLAALFEASSAQATVTPVTLISLNNPPGQSGTPFEFQFTATDAETTISFAGYQTYAYEYVSNIGVTDGDGPNLLQTFWSYTPASKGPDANMVNDGTPVRALWFGGHQQEYDTFSQSFATIPGTDYWLKFDFTNNALARLGEGYNVSALEVTTTAQGGPPIPEASTWLMMLLGFGGLGLAGYARARARLLPQR